MVYTESNQIYIKETSKMNFNIYNKLFWEMPWEWYFMTKIFPIYTSEKLL